MKNKQIIEKYIGLVFGSGSAGSNLGRCEVQHFLDLPILMRFLTELDDGEAMITKEGYDFLVEYYSLEKLSEIMLVNAPGVPYNYVGGPLKWLKDIGNFKLVDNSNLTQ